MADNVAVGPGGGGPTVSKNIAADEIGGVLFQRMKLVKGPDGANNGDIAADNPFPVEEHYEDMDVGGDGIPPINSVSAITNSAAISCDGKSKIILHTEYSDSGGTAPLLIELLDHNGVTQATTPTSLVTPANLGYQGNTIETNYYQGETVVIDVNGAKEFKIRINAAPSAGNVSVFAAVV